MVKRYRIKLSLIKLDEYGCHLMVKGRISKCHLNLIIDTGASRSVFDIAYLSDYIEPEKGKEEIHSAGISAEKLETFIARADEFILGRFKINDFPMILIDFRKINSLYSKAAGIRIHGLLGSDFLYAGNAVIDYKKLVMSISPGSVL